VSLNQSLQWHALQRLIVLLRRRGNQVFVVLGPFNEHMMTDTNRSVYRGLREGIVAWLSQNLITHITPDLLPSALYADASHPLTEGYRLIAELIYRDERFQKWSGRR